MSFAADIVTLFPELFPGPLGASVIGRGLSEGRWSLKLTQLRDFATDRHRTVDDTPSGGGAGMVLKPDILAAAIDAVSPAGDPRLAERFEFYCCGVELANAFHELIDPAEQRRRFATDMEDQQRIYGTSAPIDEDFLAALAVMPDASGCALGFDRLVMLATGADHIERVLWTPVAEV